MLLVYSFGWLVVGLVKALCLSKPLTLGLPVLWRFWFGIRLEKGYQRSWCKVLSVMSLPACFLVLVFVCPVFETKMYSSTKLSHVWRFLIILHLSTVFNTFRGKVKVACNVFLYWCAGTCFSLISLLVSQNASWENKRKLRFSLQVVC